jgi:hypothetical protein
MRKEKDWPRTSFADVRNTTVDDPAKFPVIALEFDGHDETDVEA